MPRCATRGRGLLCFSAPQLVFVIVIVITEGVIECRDKPGWALQWGQLLTIPNWVQFKQYFYSGSIIQYRVTLKTTQHQYVFITLQRMNIFAPNFVKKS